MSARLIFAYYFVPEAHRELQRFPRRIAAKILKSVIRISQHHHPLADPFVCKLAGYTTPTYRLKIGNYRAVFEVENNSLRVLEVFIRGRSY